jgi:hypothetical protein
VDELKSFGAEQSALKKSEEKVKIPVDDRNESAKFVIPQNRGAGRKASWQRKHPGTSS